MRVHTVWLVLALACGGKGAPADSADTDTDTDTDADSDADADTDTDTDVDTEPAPLTIDDLSCAPQPGNLLRYDCTVKTSVDAAVAVSFVHAAGGRDRGAESAGGTDHALTVWGLVAEDSYAWTVTATRGADTVTDGPYDVTIELPAFMAETESGVFEYEPPVTQAVLTNLKCASENVVGILDTAGRLLWYDAPYPDTFFVDALAFTDDGTVAAIYDSDHLVETRLDGTVVRDWDTAFIGGHPHHEVHISDGVAWMLVAEPVTIGPTQYIMGRVVGMALDGTEVHRWRFEDHLSYADRDCIGTWGATYPGSCDPYDPNAFGVDANGDWYLSLKQANEVVKVSGPNAPDAGAVQWRMDADGGQDIRVLNNGPIQGAFVGQHHVTSWAPGEVMMFDNLGFGGESRVLRLEIDAAAGTATPIDEIPIGITCDRVGSAFPLDGGSLLATCGTLHSFREYNADGNIAWTLATSCASAVASYRGIPIDLDAW
jgi:hypothetical protein